jgi:hypothetical protein
VRANGGGDAEPPPSRTDSARSVRHAAAVGVREVVGVEVVVVVKRPERLVALVRNRAIPGNRRVEIGPGSGR